MFSLPKAPKIARHARKARTFFGLTALAIVVNGVVLADPSSAACVGNCGAGTFNTANIKTLSDGLMWYALLACLIGIFVSSALWAMGSKGQNQGQELTGKKGIVLCCTAAFFIGAVPGMINYLDRQARRMDPVGVTAPTGERNQQVRGGPIGCTVQQQHLGINGCG